MSDPIKLKRDPAAVRWLEEKQAAYHAEAGGRRDDVDYPNKIPDVAEIEVMNEFLTKMGKLSSSERISASIVLQSNRKYQAALKARIAAMQLKFEVGDGDIWSKYERLDHRSRLIDLVRRVESAVRKRGDSLPFRPVVGTLPTREINAKAYPGPGGGGDIVAFETGMFMFTEVLARIVALSLTVRGWYRARPLVFDKQAVVAHIARHPGILLDFSDLIFSQTFLGTCQYTDKRSLPKGFRLEETYDPLHEAVDTFILAHEYGHVILRHPGIDNPVSDTERIRRELEADELGFQLTLAALDDPKWAYAGAVLFLTGSAIVDLAEAVVQTGTLRVANKPSYPSPPERLAKLAASLEHKVAPAAARAATELAQMIKWLLSDLWIWLQRAFEMAHRDGATGRLPVRVYYDKQSYLYTFLGVAFGQDFAGLRQKTDEQEKSAPGALMDTLNAELLPLLVAAFQRMQHLK